MKRTIKQQLNGLTKEEYLILSELTHTSKNLVNEAIYIKRQGLINTGLYIDDRDTKKALKDSSNYNLLNSNVAQQIVAKVDLMFKAYFGLKAAKEERKLDKSRKVCMPKYLDKEGYYSLIIQEIPKFKNGKFYVPYTWEYARTHKRIVIKLPTILVGKESTISEIRIVPRYNARFFEVHYVYNVEETQAQDNFLDFTKALVIDLGVNNFATCVDTDGNSFIIDGKKIKSYNQWYNKRNAILSSIKDKQQFGNDLTKQQIKLVVKRNNRVMDFISKASRYIVNYCISNKLGNLVLGYSNDFQKNPCLGRINNQNFAYLPFGQFKNRLEYLCSEVGIHITIQEESYTSKASFFDLDPLPSWSKESKDDAYSFSGKRISRGMYQTSKGKLINADINGALNILRKSNIVPNAVFWLYSSGALNTPIRIRLYK